MVRDIFLFIVSGICILMNIALVGSIINVSSQYQSLRIKYNDLLTNYNSANRTIRSLEDALQHMQHSQFKNSFIRSLNVDSVDDTVLDALKIAMKQSHPDNGGSSEDFIRFREALNRYSSNR